MITNLNLSTKERYLLEDQKNHEEQCILKYENYAKLACDDQLKAIFRSNGEKEKEHLQTINQLLNGKIPSMAGGQQPQQQPQQPPQSSVSEQQNTIDMKSSGNCNYNASDKDLCTDMLMTEKYVSGAYDTAIFECKDTQVRDVLNHIQKEEQKHGEAIYKYMESKGMYNAK